VAAAMANSEEKWGVRSRIMAINQVADGRRNLTKEQTRLLKERYVLRGTERIKRCYEPPYTAHKRRRGGKKRDELNKANRFIVISRIDRSLELSGCVALPCLALRYSNSSQK